MSILVEVLEIWGNLDNLKGKLLLEAAMKILLNTETTTLLLDLSKVKFIDSAGLGALVKVLKATESAGKRLTLCGLRSQVSMLLKLTRMETLFEIVSDRVALCELLNKDLASDQPLTPDKFHINTLDS